jgi:hypothetical protein
MWAVVLVAVPLGGCGSGAINARSAARPFAVTENSLTLNGLVQNGLLANGLRINGLRINGLRINGLTVDQLSLNDLPEAQSVQVMKYVVSCALPDDQSLTMTIGGTPYTFAGGLGLAPELHDASLDSPESQEWVTACLLARINAIGESVEISIRGRPDLIPTTDYERQRFTVPEGAYYGNIFTEPAELYIAPLDASTSQADIDRLHAHGRGIVWQAGLPAPVLGLSVQAVAHEYLPEWGLDLSNCSGDLDGGACQVDHSTLWQHPLFVNAPSDL